MAVKSAWGLGGAGVNTLVLLTADGFRLEMARGSSGDESLGGEALSSGTRGGSEGGAGDAFELAGSPAGFTTT